MRTLRALHSAPLAPAAGLQSPYLYSITPHSSAALAAISSDDFVRAFNAETLQVISEVKHEGVTCLQPAPGEGISQGMVLFTAGRNAEVRAWDGRSESSRKLVSSEGLKVPITSLASSPEGHRFATGMEQSHSVASVAIWDARSSKLPVVHYPECHNDDVTELMFSLTLPSTLLSGSTDGLVNVYNTTISNEDDALEQVINHGASIHHAGFITPLIGNDYTALPDSLIYTLSHDETFSLYCRSDSSSDVETMQKDEDCYNYNLGAVLGDLRPRLDCEYVVDVLSTKSGLIAISGKHSEKRLDLVPLNFGMDWQFDLGRMTRLVGAHGDEVVRTVHIDEKMGNIYTGGEDGLIKVWKIGHENWLNMEQAVAKSGAPVRQGPRGKDNHYKPY